MRGRTQRFAVDFTLILVTVVKTFVQNEPSASRRCRKKRTDRSVKLWLDTAADTNMFSSKIH